MVLAESAAGDLPGLGDVLAGLEKILAELSRASGIPIAERAELTLPGAWEIARQKGRKDSPIDWNDSGTVRVTNEVPGGTFESRGEWSNASRALRKNSARSSSKTPVSIMCTWGRAPSCVLPVENFAKKILFATNALSLEIAHMTRGTHPKLTLAAMTAPISDARIEALGLSQRSLFYTVDFPYLWGRVCPNNSIVWGAGLVDAPLDGTLEDIDVSADQSAKMFASLEGRIRHLKPGFEDLSFTHLWGGPIMFRENWTPVFSHHPESDDGIVIGAFAGHGVALSSYPRLVGRGNNARPPRLTRLGPHG